MSELVYPNITSLVLSNWKNKKTFSNKIVALLEFTKKYYESYKIEENENEDFLGFVYSDSLFEDATDNIFYVLKVIKCNNKNQFSAEVTLQHNASNHKLSIIVKPTNYKLENANQHYNVWFSNNAAFPLIYTHLLYRALDKMLSEVKENDFESLSEVAILKQKV